MNRIWIAATAALMVGGLAGAAMAQDMATVIKTRQEHFKQIGGAAKGMSDQLKSGKPSPTEVQAYAKRLDDLAPQIVSWFPKGSGPESNLKTHAKADIWQKPDEFKKDADALAVETHKLDMVAASGDMAMVAVQMKAVGQACGTCHKTFREKED